MNYKKVSKSLRNIANKTLTQDDLDQQIIIQKGSVYHAFKDYKIEETVFGWQVTSSKIDDKLFNTAKTALAWCIAHKFGLYNLTKNLQLFDEKVAAKQFDIDVLTYKLDTVSNSDENAILTARLMEDINSRQSYKKQLAKCIETAKYIKLKELCQHEFNRFNKTSRR